MVQGVSTKTNDIPVAETSVHYSTLQQGPYSAQELPSLGITAHYSTQLLTNDARRYKKALVFDTDTPLTDPIRCPDESTKQKRNH